MDVMGIRALFPLGVYRGHLPDRQPDILPSPLRLHAALVAAAGNGSTAEAAEGALRRTAGASRALEWLEANPPEYVQIPRWTMNGRAGLRVFAYRDEGVVENVSAAPTRRKTPRFVVDATAVDGPIGWGWDAVPVDVLDELSALCADVPCLGEADSPVVLETGPIEPTHRRARRQSPFAPVAVRLSVPKPGRLGELDADYDGINPKKAPSASADSWAATEKLAPPAISHRMAESLGYESIEPALADAAAPWRHVIHVPVNREIGQEERVAWSVALHRALVSSLGDAAPSLITGKYPTGAQQPPNRVAIQPLAADLMTLSKHADLGAGFGLLVPAGGVDDVLTALTSLKRLYRGAEGALDLGRPSIMDAADFWREPAPGLVRLWAAVPAIVPETRRQKNRGVRSWTLSDSALLSVGFVYRDHLDVVPADTAAERYSVIVDAVEAAGVRAVQTARIADSNVDRYAHKLPRGVVAQPYRATLTSGSLIGECSLVAVGQARHLGGGLLCPLDVPEAIAEAWGVEQ